MLSEFEKAEIEQHVARKNTPKMRRPDTGSEP